MINAGWYQAQVRRAASVLREQGMEMAVDGDTLYIPSVDTLFVQRMISGTALLAAWLKAKVDVRNMIASVMGAA